MPGETNRNLFTDIKNLPYKISLINSYLDEEKHQGL